MSSNTEGVNPLRPYYIPPTIGEAPTDVRPSGGPNSFSRGNATTAGSGYASKARDMFQDLDYNYLNESQPSMVQSAKELLDELLWKYTSVLMAQPFEVAKMILQTRDQDSSAAFSSQNTPDQSIKRSSSYASSSHGVCGPVREAFHASIDVLSSYLTPTPMVTSQTISRPTFRTRHPQSTHITGDKAADAAFLQSNQPHCQLVQTKQAVPSRTSLFAIQIQFSM